MDLAGFIAARLDEDVVIAREAAGITENWIAEHRAIGVVLVDGEPLIEGHIAGLTDHIARHDPARVLREAAAKRAILAEHAIYEPGQYAGYPQFWSCSACGAAGYGESYEVGWPCPTVRHLAAVWSDHPDYQPDWKPC